MDFFFSLSHSFSSGGKSRTTLSDHVGDEQNKFLRSNIAQLLALTVDCIIDFNGGLKLLQSLACPVVHKASKVGTCNSTWKEQCYSSMVCTSLVPRLIFSIKQKGCSIREIQPGEKARFVHVISFLDHLAHKRGAYLDVFVDGVYEVCVSKYQF